MAVMSTNPNGHHEPVSGGMPAPDEDDHSSDTSSLIEISSQEFPTYFVERDNRLFPSHGGPSYPFPVDGHEQNVRFPRLSPIPPFPHSLQHSSLFHILTQSLRVTSPSFEWDVYSE